jgi:molybdopterin-biosynthesis enzyme MoeA-like protein
MEGVAEAFGRELVENTTMTEMLRKAMRGREPNESQLKMCRLPEGAELRMTPDLWFPLVQVGNVYIFPGIPRLLHAKFNSMRDEFKGEPFFLRRIFMGCIESDIAQELHDLLEDFPELRLGSYPRVAEEDYATLLTLESRDKAYVDRAVDSLVAKMPPAEVVRVE